METINVTKVSKDFSGKNLSIDSFFNITVTECASYF